MSRGTLRALAAFVALVGCGSPVAAQDPTSAPSPIPADVGDPLKSLVEKDLLPAAGRFTYKRAAPPPPPPPHPGRGGCPPEEPSREGPVAGGRRVHLHPPGSQGPLRPWGL